jgi:GDPmannose 4,6-dehydratase
MYLILQNKEPEDFVLATGETHPVREFVEKAFGHVGISVKWEGTDVDEIGICTKTGKTIVRVDPVRVRSFWRNRD